MPRIVILILAILAARPLAAEEVTVYAAASLREAMEAVVETFEAETGHDVTISLAGSSALARQIEQGAPADVFVSANAAWMDHLEARGLVLDGSRRDILSNSLVLVGPAGAARVEISPALDLSSMLGSGRLAMALVDAVPAGIYGRQALTSLGLWADVADRVAQADNVRAALALVALGAAPLGIVYATDAQADPRVAVLGTFPASSHPPVIYPAAATPRAGPAALEFLDFLASDPAGDTFAAFGFTRPE
ncbi:MAG: molybdate ABC transporter substrate-binding protein [Pseudooceanicola sp.]